MRGKTLQAAFPDALDRVGAAALTGVLTGAVHGALDALMERALRTLRS